MVVTGCADTHVLTGTAKRHLGSTAASGLASLGAEPRCRPRAVGLCGTSQHDLVHTAPLTQSRGTER